MTVGIWIRAFLREPLALSPDELVRLLDQSDWFMFAENQDLDDEEGPRAKARFRIERLPETAGGHRIRHREDPAHFIRADHWTGAATAEEIRESLESGAPVPAQVRAALASCVESFAFDLKSSDTRDLGWPICFHLAMGMSALRGGVVDADGVWWEPRTFRELT